MKNERTLLSLLTVIFIAIILFNIGGVVFQNLGKYTSSDFWKRFPTLKQTYLDSQYVNKHPKEWIPDEVVNTFAGASYVKGVSPVLIAPDTPPVGRYLIGLSVLLFNNENIITLLCGFLSLFLLYLLGTQIFPKKLLALLPPVLLSFEMIFKNQFIYTPLLDIMQLVFLLGSLYSFNKGLMAKRKYLFSFIIASIFLGLFISTKFYITGLTIIGAWYIVLFLRKEKKRIVYLTLTLPIAIAILLISYIQVLFTGYQLSKFLGIQKYVFFYHKSQLILPFSIWDLLLFNKWHVWFGNKPVISDTQWSITWPVITIISLATVLIYMLRRVKRCKPIEVAMAWIIFYLLFFSFGQISSRYFVILIPILYVVAVFGVYQGYLFTIPLIRKKIYRTV